MAENPRMKRLQADYARLLELSRRSTFVYLMDTEGNPPGKYELRLTCKGITHVENDQPFFSEDHRLNIYLPPGYPRERPVFQMMTPVWHPNIARNGSVCYGDAGDHGWTPGMELDDLVVRLINMIRYENMGLNSAFNGPAASWAARNKHLFPLDNSQIARDDPMESIIIGDEMVIIHPQGGDEVDITIVEQ